jgi:hypothetical protein
VTETGDIFERVVRDGVSPRRIANAKDFMCASTASLALRTAQTGDPTDSPIVAMR